MSGYFPPRPCHNPRLRTIGARGSFMGTGMYPIGEGWPAIPVVETDAQREDMLRRADNRKRAAGADAATLIAFDDASPELRELFSAIEETRQQRKRDLAAHKRGSSGTRYKRGVAA